MNERVINEYQETSNRAFLTPREKEVAQLILQGLSNEEIANELSLTVKTIQNYINSLYTYYNLHHTNGARMKLILAIKNCASIFDNLEDIPKDFITFQTLVEQLQTIDSKYDIDYVTIKLGGECGEVLNLIGKAKRENNFEKYKSRIEEELGDLLYFLTRDCIAMRLNLDNIASQAYNKMRIRKQQLPTEINET